MRADPGHPLVDRPVRHGRLARSSAWRTLALVLVVVIGIIAVSGGAVAALAAWDVATSVKPGVQLAHEKGAQAADPGADVSAISGGVNLLLVGTDTRTDQGEAFGTSAELSQSSGAGKNDVTMLVHINQDHHSVSVISFPRDLMVAVPACPVTGAATAPASAREQLNSTLARGGLPCVVLTIEKLTGLQIPFAAQISFAGVTKMSIAVGGVDVCVASPIDDPKTNPPLHLAAGQQTIVGDEALSFLRTRHGVADGSDLGRISNQQVFLAALARKVVGGGVLGNPIQLYSLAKAATSSMVLSDTLTNPTTLVQIALALGDTGLQNMVFFQYPTVADPLDANRVIPDASAAPIVNAALTADQPIALSGQPGPAATGGAATPTPTSTAPTPPAPTTPSPSTPPAAELPATVTGQTAAEQTCSKGNE